MLCAAQFSPGTTAHLPTPSGPLSRVQGVEGHGEAVAPLAATLEQLRLEQADIAERWVGESS